MTCGEGFQRVTRHCYPLGSEPNRHVSRDCVANSTDVITCKRQACEGEISRHRLYVMKYVQISCKMRDYHFGLQ